MKHSILRIFLSLTITATPLAVAAANDAPAAFAETDITGMMAEEPGEINVELNGNVLHITGAQGSALEVFDITGKKVFSARIDSHDKRITLNLGKGCYIVRVGKITRKIALS